MAITNRITDQLYYRERFLSRKAVWILAAFGRLVCMFVRQSSNQNLELRSFKHILKIWPDPAATLLHDLMS